MLVMIKKMIICGDFNIDLVHVNTSKVANTFFDTMISLGCSYLINRPTRIDTKHNSSSIIDNIFTNFNMNRFSGIIISDISDHFQIVLNLQLKLNLNSSYISNAFFSVTSSSHNTRSIHNFSIINFKKELRRRTLIYVGPIT